MITFELLPIIDIMIDLYEQPRSFERFEAYLKMLQGNTKGDLAMPISGFNPMAKEHLLAKLKELKTIEIEQIIREKLNDWNSNNSSKNSSSKFKVAINLADDLQGGWTNRFTSDYDSKFRFNGLFSRNFCTPFFWTSECFTEDMIRERVLSYILRTIYWQKSPQPMTLLAHLEQEIFVAKQINTQSQFRKSDFKELHHFFQKNQTSEQYHLIFNFFYGDKASASLAFPTYGIIENITGFDYANCTN
jgi:hypothetical protein